MRMIRIKGVATTLQCVACGTTGVGGAEPYESAASGEKREPENWYMSVKILGETEDHTGPYCAGCAAKIVEAADPTRSVAQFYSNNGREDRT